MSIDAIRARHVRHDHCDGDADGTWPHCAVHDMGRWPCDTALVLADRDRWREDAERLAEALRRLRAAAGSVAVLGPGALSTPDMSGAMVASADALAAHDALEHAA